MGTLTEASRTLTEASKTPPKPPSLIPKEAGEAIEDVDAWEEPREVPQDLRCAWLQGLGGLGAEGEGVGFTGCGVHLPEKAV